MRSYTPQLRKALGELRSTLWIGRPRNSQEMVVMRDQCNLLFLLCLLFPAAGLPNIMLNALAFEVAGSVPMLSMILIVTAIYAMIILEAFIWYRNRDNFRFLRNAAVLYVFQGVAWGSTIILFSMNGRPDQTGLLLGISAAVVSTPIISVPLTVALAFFIPDALLSIYAIVFVMPGQNFSTSASFISFTVYVMIGIVFNNIHFGGRSKARAALHREIQTVNIFLREYEEGSTDWLWQTDRYGRIEMAARRMAEATGVEVDALNGRLLSQFVTPIDDNTARTGEAIRDVAYFFHHRLAFREILVRYDGPAGQRLFRLTGHPVFRADGEFAGFRGVGRDVTADQKARERVSFLAEHDSLTGLVNRGTFLQMVERLCAQNQPFALLLIDIDNFKSINDTHGHYVGDQLLKVMADRMRHSTRPTSVIARLGGDEFAAIILGAGQGEGIAAARRMAADFGRGFSIEDLVIPTGVSVGVSVFPDDAQDPERLRMLADLALYRAKEEGKGQAVLFAPDIEEQHRLQVDQEVELRDALENGEIRVVYQPIVDIKSGVVVASEALVRWHHPTRGVILPGDFIATAERSELMEVLGELVLRIACHDAAHWSEPVQVNVNLSPRQLQSGRFPQILTETLEETGLAPGRLAIEITENVLLDQEDRTMSQLHVLRDMGIHLILDDFGTGYSSLTYLHNVEVSGLKVDSTFMQKLADQKVKVIYRTIARLAMDLNIYIEAEGVEEPEQLKWLDQNGIRFAQGYLLGRPSSSAPTKRVQYLS